MKNILYILLFAALTTNTFAQLKIIHPNGGERLQAGSQTKIIWETEHNAEKYEIGFSYTNGRYWELVTDTAKGNSYDWSVPTIIKDSCLIRIENSVLKEEWSVALDTLKNYNTQHLINSKNGGYIVVENTWVNGSKPTKELKKDIRVIRTDDLGKQIWSKELVGMSGDDIANAAIEDDNGNIYIIGETDSTDFGIEFKGLKDLLLIKLDSEGKLIWKKIYGGSKPDLGFDIIPDNKGNFILGGYTISNDGDVQSSPEWADYWVIKINADGAIIWENTYGRERDELLLKLRLGKNNEIVILGSSDSRDSVYMHPKYGNYINKTHPWIVKLDSIGNMLWDYQYAKAIDNTYDFIIQEDGSILTTGYSVEFTNDQPINYNWILILNSDGKVKKSRYWKVSSFDSTVEILLSKKGMIYFLSNVYNSYRITNINSNGDLIWYRDFYNLKAANSFVESDYGGLVIAGIREKKRDFFESMLRNLSIDDVFESTTTEMFSIGDPVSSVINSDNNINFTVRPNIASNTANVSVELTENGATTLELFDSQGRKMQTVLSGAQATGIREIPIDVSQYPSGRYYLKLTTPTISKTEMLEVQR